MTQPTSATAEMPYHSPLQLSSANLHRNLQHLFMTSPGVDTYIGYQACDWPAAVFRRGASYRNHAWETMREGVSVRCLLDRAHRRTPYVDGKHSL